MHARHALIFDLDGTLVNSLDDITDALNAALRRLLRTPQSSDSVRDWIGDGLPALCRRAAPDADDATLELLHRYAAEAYHAGYLNRTRPYNNILKMLDLLKQAGVPAAVLSNKPHPLAVQVVRGLEMEKYFCAVRGYVTEEERKPSPVAALEMTTPLGVPPSKILLVGDSVVDIRTARNAGMRPVAVTWGFQSREALIDERPDLLVDDPMEIVALIQAG